MILAYLHCIIYLYVYMARINIAVLSCTNAVRSRIEPPFGHTHPKLLNTTRGVVLNKLRDDEGGYTWAIRIVHRRAIRHIHCWRIACGIPGRYRLQAIVKNRGWAPRTSSIVLSFDHIETSFQLPSCSRSQNTNAGACFWICICWLWFPIRGLRIRESTSAAHSVVTKLLPSLGRCIHMLHMLRCRRFFFHSCSNPAPAPSQFLPMLFWDKHCKHQTHLSKARKASLFDGPSTLSSRRSVRGRVCIRGIRIAARA